MKFSIMQNEKELFKKLDAFALKQVPFAMKKTLNDLAEGARDELVKDVKRSFTVRKDWWKEKSKYGLRVRYASKTKLRSMVFTKAPWLPRHESGGVQTPAGKFFTIPSHELRDKYTKMQIIPRRARPKALMKSKRRLFFVEIQGRGEYMLLERYGPRVKRRRSRSRKGMRTERSKVNRVRAWYFLTKRTDLDVTFRFKEIGTKFISENGHRLFAENLRMSVSTGRF